MKTCDILAEEASEGGRKGKRAEVLKAAGVTVVRLTREFQSTGTRKTTSKL